MYPEGIVTFEENLKVIFTSKTYKEFQRIKNDKMSRSSKEEVNNKYKLSLGIGNEHIRQTTGDSGSKKGNDLIKVSEKDESISRHDELIDRCKYDDKESINSIQDPFIFNINPEDFPVNLSESSSEDESDSTKKNTEKFPTIAATAQQSRAQSDYKSNNKENVGTKSVSDGSHGISRSHKRNLLRKEKVRRLSDSSSEDESDSTKENTKKFPTITATAQQSRVNSEYTSYNIENVGTKSVSDGSHIISRSNKIKQLLKVKERNLSESSSKDELDSTKKNTEKFSTITATTQQSRTKSEYKNFNTEDVRIKSVSDGSNKRKLLLKMKERNSSYKKVATIKNNEKFSTITATTQQSRAKSECKSYNIENVGTMCACDESQYLETIKESYYRR